MRDEGTTPVFKPGDVARVSADAFADELEGFTPRERRALRRLVGRKCVVVAGDGTYYDVTFMNGRKLTGVWGGLLERPLLRAEPEGQEERDDRESKVRQRQRQEVARLEEKITPREGLW